MNVENLVPDALCHLDNWLHEPSRLTEVSNGQLELLGAVSILVTHVEQQRIAEEEARLDVDGVTAPDDVPNVPVAACCANFMLEAMSETLGVFTEDSDHPAVDKLREAFVLLSNYVLQAQR